MFKQIPEEWWFFLFLILWKTCCDKSYEILFLLHVHCSFQIHISPMLICTNLDINIVWWITLRILWIQKILVFSGTVSSTILWKSILKVLNYIIELLKLCQPKEKKYFLNFENLKCIMLHFKLCIEVVCGIEQLLVATKRLLDSL